MRIFQDRHERQRRLRHMKMPLLACIAIIALLAIAFAAGTHVQRFDRLLPLLIGVALIVYGGGALYRARRARAWPVVTGRILRSRVEEIFVPTKGGGHFEHYPAPEFEYCTPSGLMTSNRYSIAPKDFRDIDSAKAEKLLRPFPDGAQVDVHVCPTDPSLAILSTELSRKRRSQYLAAIVGGMLVCGVAAMMFGLST